MERHLSNDPLKNDGNMMHLVALKADIGIKVHHKDQVSSLEGQDFVHAIADGHEFVLRAQPFEAIFQGLHQLIKVLKILVAQRLVIRQIPSSATEMVAPSVLSSWEIDPLWMPKLIAHEVQIACTCSSWNGTTKINAWRNPEDLDPPSQPPPSPKTKSRKTLCRAKPRSTTMEGSGHDARLIP